MPREAYRAEDGLEHAPGTNVADTNSAFAACEAARDRGVEEASGQNRRPHGHRSRFRPWKRPSDQRSAAFHAIVSFLPVLSATRGTLDHLQIHTAM